MFHNKIFFLFVNVSVLCFLFKFIFKNNEPWKFYLYTSKTKENMKKKENIRTNGNQNGLLIYHQYDKTMQNIIQNFNNKFNFYF